MTGEVPLKKRLVNRDGFYGRNFIFALEADDPVNHQKRVAVRKDLHYFASVQTGIAYWDRARCAHRASPRLLASERASQFRIRSIPGLARYHVTAAHDNRVFEAAALDHIFIHEWLNILVVNKCARRSDLAVENRRRNFQ